MNNITFILTAAGTVILLIAALVICIRIIRSRNERIKQLTENNSRLRDNLEECAKYIEKMNFINKDEKTISREIADAETDEEIIDIINNIIKSNNDRMRNDRQTGSGSAAKTGKK